METGRLGKTYPDREVIVREGEVGDCMFVIQAGRVEVTRRVNDREIRIAVLEAGDVFGEMALFGQETRSATVRALGEARVLSIDKREFLRGVHKDPSLAFRILQRMSQRIRDLDAEVARLKARD